MHLSSPDERRCNRQVIQRPLLLDAPSELETRIDMKTTEVRGEDQIRESDEHKASPVVATGSPVSSQLLTLIEQQPFFKGLSGPHLQLLADSAMATQFEAGHWIFRQGDPANRFYLILEGKVLIESEVKERGMIPIRTLGPGDDLGWAWLFPPHYMHFNACAVDPTRAIFFYGTRLRAQCEENHELGYQVMRRVAEVVVQNLNATQQRFWECTDIDRVLKRDLPRGPGWRRYNHDGYRQKENKSAFDGTGVDAEKL
jgi:CRP-like cAMP-binding protein